MPHNKMAQGLRPTTLDRILYPDRTFDNTSMISSVCRALHVAKGSSI